MMEEAAVVGIVVTVDVVVAETVEGVVALSVVEAAAVVFGTIDVEVVVTVVV